MVSRCFSFSKGVFSGSSRSSRYVFEGVSVYHFFPIAMTPWKFQIITLSLQTIRYETYSFPEPHHKNFRFSCPHWIQWLFGDEFVSPKSVMDFSGGLYRPPKLQASKAPFVMDSYKIPVAQGWSWKKSFWNMVDDIGYLLYSYQIDSWMASTPKKNTPKEQWFKETNLSISTSERNITELERYFSFSL